MARLCSECRVEAVGECPFGFAQHLQCPCCYLCVREDGCRRSCGGNYPELQRLRHEHNARVPMSPINR